MSWRRLSASGLEFFRDQTHRQVLTDGEREHTVEHRQHEHLSEGRSSTWLFSAVEKENEEDVMV